MSNPSNFIKNIDWRNDLVSRQGFDTSKPKTMSTDQLKGLIDTLAYVQLDSIRTVERAHHCILFSRNQAYKQSLLHELTTKEGALFENWTHDACTLPVEHFPLIKLRFEREKKRLVTANWWGGAGEQMPKLCELVREHIGTHGPLPMRYFTDLTSSKPLKQGMWQWSPIKTAVEFMWRTGEIAVAERVNFNKVYNYTERLIPGEHYHAEFTETETVREMCLIALKRLGFTTVKEVADFWGFLTQKETRACVEKLQIDGLVRPFQRQLANDELQACYVLEDEFEAWSDEQSAEKIGLKILSPFDPLVRNRNRLASFFDFEYRFEAFTPQAKRKYGYYVFPVINDNRFIGRVDMALGKDKSKSELIVSDFWPETGVRKTLALEAKLKRQLKAFAAFSGVKELNIRAGYWH